MSNHIDHFPQLRTAAAVCTNNPQEFTEHEKSPTAKRQKSEQATNQKDVHLPACTRPNSTRSSQAHARTSRSSQASRHEGEQSAMPALTDEPSSRQIIREIHRENQEKHTRLPDAQKNKRRNNRSQGGSAAVGYVNIPTTSPARRQRPIKKQWSGLLPSIDATPTVDSVADQIFKLLDVNSDSQIHKFEWALFHEVLEGHNTGGLIERIGSSKDDSFCYADMDGNSTITKEEWGKLIQAFVGMVGEREWNKLSKKIIQSIKQRRASEADNLTTTQAPSKLQDALSWLEGKDAGAWLQPDGDCCVSYSQDEIVLLKKYFKMRDTDNSSSLSWPELDHVIQDIGRTPRPGSQGEKLLEELKARADTDGNGSLNFEEFLGFMCAYRHAVYARVFAAFDDGSNHIPKSELENVLVLVTHIAGFETSWDRMRDLLDQSDDDADAKLNFEEFCQLMSTYRKFELEQLKSCSGFHEGKVDGLKHLFSSADLDQSGSLDVREVATLLDKTDLGRPLDTREDLHAFSCVFKRMDRDQSSSLDFEEFLRLLRVWAGGGHLNEEDERHNLSSGAQEVRFEKFGEFKNDILDGWAEEFEHDMEDAVISSKWGLSEEEVRTMRDCFEFKDINGSGKIQGSELVPFMESVGHVLKSEKQQEALTNVMKERDTVDGFEFAEAVEVVYTFEKELAKLALDGENNTVKMDNLLSLFYRIGVYLLPKQLTALVETVNNNNNGGQILTSESTIDCQTLQCLLEAMRSNHMTRWCETCGFKPHIVEKYGSAFTKMLGEFGTNECELMLEKVRELVYQFGLVGQGQAEKSKMFRAITRVDRDNSGTMSFREFLLLVRYFKNKEMYRNTQRNQQAMIHFKIDSESGEQLLKLFSMKDPDDDYYIAQEDVVTIFSDLGLGRHPDQKAVIRKSISGWSKGNSDLTVTFPDFLQILQDADEELQKLTAKR
eukprot:gnl/MRDRNA2_/MRDRNA2_35518_c0_seq1.p1 gnl/MRDRNA2_/MRDRNA2_35518_c0~~gnl/MRDRNA2_/MRDRNA2_35518_c0_seq1.p1  ORF type:complete len:945 (-),score=181.46 gnl/MRDRNA2_/MRDRNA2_35518_c0_seq1:379-3213(-)